MTTCSICGRNIQEMPHSPDWFECFACQVCLPGAHLRANGCMKAKAKKPKKKRGRPKKTLISSGSAVEPSVRPSEPKPKRPPRGMRRPRL